MFEDLKKIQLEMARKVSLKDKYRIEELEYVIGVDQAFLEDRIISAAVKFTYPELKEVESNFTIKEVEFPYIPTFLMFREGEPALSALKKILNGKCIILVDGSGIAHPRRCGLATYIAIKTSEPSIGVTKRKLFGEEVKLGDDIFLKDGNEIIGSVLKSCKRCKPIYISPGSFVSVESSIEIVKSCIKGHKLPEPIRAAHNLANEVKSSHI
ncbi:MAG: endonuclease V [Archaeoglobaceae archaeon]